MRVAVPGQAAALGCCGMAVVVGLGEAVAVEVPRGLGSGLVRRG